MSPRPPEPPPLTARGLHKHYRGATAPALVDVDLDVAAGEIVGLLGPNGAGKTTAISLMSTLLPPDRGEVSIHGIDIRRHSRKARRHFGLVPQEIALYPALTARENLTYLGRLYGLRGRSLRDRVADRLEMVGLSARADVRISVCSGGMKRRANLAAGLIHHPRLLFLDEPTVGIDAQSRQMILDRLAGLRDDGMAMVYTTHYMEEAEALCSRIAVIDAGRVIARGRPADLVADHPDCRHLGDLFLRLTGRTLRD